MRKVFTLAVAVVGWAILLPVLFLYAILVVCVGLVAMVLDIITKDKNI